MFADKVTSFEMASDTFIDKASGGDERAAILEVVEKETNAYLKKDFALWSSYWHQGPEALRMFSFGAYGAWTETGWDNIAAVFKHFMELDPEPSASIGQFERLNFRVFAGADMAWVYHDHLGTETGDAFQSLGHLSELKILRKASGFWQLMVCVSVRQNLRVLNCPLIQVEDGTRIVWVNSQARARLLDHPALTISGAYLKARNKTSQSILDRAIEEVGQFRENRLVGAERQMPVVPLALTNRDHDGVSICWVSLLDHKVVVTFEDEDLLDKNLAASAVLYRLSEAQVRLCRIITNGHNLTDAAKMLAVSPNTLRTQLQRVFDKTGVRNKSALVRALIGNNPPRA